MAGKKKGQSQAVAYTPGQSRPNTRELVPEGDGQFTLKSYGKAGAAGWHVKPNKFPCRYVDYELVGSEGQDGSPLSFRDFASSSPAAFFRIFDLAAAVSYPVGFALDSNPTKPSDPGVRDLCEWIDGLLSWIEENNVVLNGTIKHEEYNGQPNARVNWLPPEEGSFVPEAEEEEDEGEGEDDAVFEEEAVAEEEQEEVIAPPSPKRKAPLAKLSAPALTSVSGKKRAG